MPFRVMTWNVENLFPVGTKLSANSKPITQEQFDSKLEFLAACIKAQAPDIVALQEIGGSNAADLSMLTALQEALPGKYPHRAAGEPDGRGIRVAILSKLPLEDATNVVDFPAGPLSSVPNYEGQEPITQMGRGALSVRVTPADSGPIRIITAHLKSKLITYPGNRFAPKSEKERAEGAGIALARRTAEAVALRLHVNQILAETKRLILVGDLNDGPQAGTSQILLGPADGNIETGDQGDAVRLHNLTDAVPRQGIKEKVFLPEGEQFSRRHEGRGEMLDQILATKDLIFRDEQFQVSQVRSLVNLIQGENVTGTPGERVGAEASDHAPVFADFEL